MTNTVKQQILAIRATGETNMFDVNRVQHIANRKGYYELVVYLESHRKAVSYTHLSPTSTRRVPSITGRSWRPMSAAPCRGLKGGDGMTYEDIVMLIVAAVVFCLFSIVSTALFIKESDRCCRLRRENQKLRRLMEQRIQMDSDCLNAYCAMLREASRSDTRK